MEFASEPANVAELLPDSKVDEQDERAKVVESFQLLGKELSDEKTFETPFLKSQSAKIFTGHESEGIIELRSRLSSKINEVLEDSDCLRFLRARSMSVSAALKMVQEWYRWYYVEKLRICDTDLFLSPREILKLGYDEQDLSYPKQQYVNQLLPHCFCCEDKLGNPIYWEKTGVAARNMPEVKKVFSVDDLVLLHIRGMEFNRLRASHQTKKYNRAIDQHVIIFDLNNISYAIEPIAFRSFHRFIVIDQAYYPETLRAVFFINAPWFFPYIWAIIRPWMDPNTANKIQVLGVDFLPKLREYVDDDNIPEEYGGNYKGIIWHPPYPVSSGCSSAQMREYCVLKGLVDSTTPSSNIEVK